MNATSHVRAQIALRKMLRIPFAPRQVMPRQLAPELVALEYAKEIEQFLSPVWSLIEREVLPLLQQTLRRDADWNELLDTISEKFFRALSTSAMTSLLRTTVQRTSSWQRSQLRQQIVAGLGIDLPLGDPAIGPALDAFISENIAAIKTIPNRFLDDVEKEVVSAVRKGVRYADLAQTLEARFAVSKSQAVRLAQDQTRKLYADLNQARQQDLGLTRYVWRTMSDNRVRGDHARREGKAFSWDSPPSGGHPGDATGCRCYAEPDLTPLLEAA